MTENTAGLAKDTAAGAAKKGKDLKALGITAAVGAGGVMAVAAAGSYQKGHLRTFNPIIWLL